MAAPILPFIGPYRGDDGRLHLGCAGMPTGYRIVDELPLIPDLIAEDCTFFLCTIGGHRPLIDLNPYAGAGRGQKRHLEDAQVILQGELPNNVQLRRCKFVEVPEPDYPTTGARLWATSSPLAMGNALMYSQRKEVSY